MKHRTRFGLTILLGILIMIIFLMPVVQGSYGDKGTITVNASKEKKVVSFTITTSNNSPAIYGFIVTSVNHGHYAKVVKSPDGWLPGNIRYHVALWTTKSHPIQPGSTMDDFATEVTRKGTYVIRWSVLDNTLQPAAWGIITVTVT